MMQKYKVSHLTKYIYSQSVNNSYNKLCLKPQSFDNQTLLSYDLAITPAPIVLESNQDFFGNQVHLFSIHKSHKSLEVKSVFEVLVYPKQIDISMVDNISIEEAVSFSKNLKGEYAHIQQFSLASNMIKLTDDARSFIKPLFQTETFLFPFCLKLCEKIYKEFKFVPGFTTISTPISEVLKQKKGVCQDFAHLALTCFRVCGISAKYVSGYIETLPPPGKPKLAGSDASHAWVSVYFPNFGWIDFDPTNNLIPYNQHITIAYGRDYADVIPLKGVVYNSGDQKLSVAVDVERIN